MPDVSVRPVLWSALAIGGVVVLVVAVVLGSLHLMDVPPGGERLRASGDAHVEAPGLSSAPQDELQRDRAGKQARLASAGWVDRERGIAHIPIGDAMDLLVARRAGEAKP